MISKQCNTEKTLVYWLGIMSMLVVTLGHIYWTLPVQHMDELQVLLSKNMTHPTLLKNFWQQNLLQINKHILAQPNTQPFNYNGMFFQSIWSIISTSYTPKTLALWRAINLFLIITGLQLMLAATPTLPARYKPWLTTIALVSYPVITSLVIAEVIGPTTFFVGLFAWLCYRQYTRSLSICLGLMVAFKYFFAIYWLWLLRQRQWSILGISLLTLIFIQCVALVFTSKVDFFQHWQTLSMHWDYILFKSQLKNNFNLLGLMTRSILFFNGQNTWRVWQLLCFYSILSTTLILFQYRATAKGSAHIISQSNIAEWGLLGLILSPLGWHYYLPVAWWALCLKMQNIIRESAPWPYTCLVGFIIATLFGIINNHNEILYITPHHTLRQYWDWCGPNIALLTLWGLPAPNKATNKIFSAPLPRGYVCALFSLIPLLCWIPLALRSTT